MRRVLAYVSLSLGMLLLFLSPFLVFYAIPRLQKAPVDHYDRITSDGIGEYFSTKPDILGLVGPVPLENTADYRPDVSASTSDVAVYDYFASTKDLTRNAVIEASRQRYVFDRKTALPVHCCGETPEHEGLTLKFPFDVQRQTYPFWDDTARKAFPANYVRDDSIDGLKVYLFRSDVPETVIGHVTISGEAAGQPDEDTVVTDQMYEATTLVWIDPVTGAVVRGQRTLRQWLQNPNTDTELQVLENVQIGYTDEYIADNVRYVKDSVKQLKVLNALPIVGPIIGLILIAVGLLLLLWKSSPKAKKKQKPTPASETQPSTA